MLLGNQLTSKEIWKYFPLFVVLLEFFVLVGGRFFSLERCYHFFIGWKYGEFCQVKYLLTKHRHPTYYTQCEWCPVPYGYNSFHNHSFIPPNDMSASLKRYELSGLWLDWIDGIVKWSEGSMKWTSLMKHLLWL